MKSTQNDVFAQMKNEDRKFGERMGKASKAQPKMQKHRQDFKNMKPQDVYAMSDDMDDDME